VNRMAKSHGEPEQRSTVVVDVGVLPTPVVDAKLFLQRLKKLSSSPAYRPYR